MSNIDTVRGTARETGVDVLRSVGAAASSVTTTLHMIGDLSAAGRVKSRRLLHDVQVKDTSTRVGRDEVIMQAAAIEVAASKARIRAELAKNPDLQADYDATYAEIKAKVAAIK